MTEQIKAKTRLMMVTMMLLCGCNRCKDHYILTAAANGYNAASGCPVNLYREYYRVYRGYMTTDNNSVYLTDSVHFRLYLGTYDEGNEKIQTACKGDTLFVKKLGRKDMGFDSDEEVNRKILFYHIYHLAELKKQHSFD